MSDPLAALEELADDLGMHATDFHRGTAARLRAAIAKTREVLDEEFRWVPVDQVGERWEPRSRAEAEALMRDHPAGALFPGITRIEKQTRFVTPWKTVEEA